MTYNDDGNRQLSRKLRRKYAKAKQAFELGIWCSEDIDLVKGFTVTTAMNTFTKKGRSRNTWSQLVQDWRNMRKALRKAGILAEDCSCVEISPVNHLLHMHGFFRLQAPYYAADLHKMVSEHWEKIHGAKVVWIKDLWDVDGAVKYDVKHAVKNYLAEGYNSMRLIKSKGWWPFWLEAG